jgi:hypothetical protein
MSRIENAVRQFLVRDALTEQLSDEPLRQTGGTEPDTRLDPDVLLGEFRTQSCFTERWLRRRHSGYGSSVGPKGRGG